MNSKGFSQIEIMMAVGMIAVAVYLMSGIGSTYVSREYTLRRACESYAESIVGAVQEETYYRTFGNFIPNETDGRTPNPAAIFQETTAVQAANLSWYLPTTNNEISTTGPAVTTAPVLRNNLLIQGSLSTLAAIYNNMAVVRCAYGHYEPLTAIPNVRIPLPRDMDTLTPVALMRLEPYNAATGASQCGVAPPIVIAPSGVRGVQDTPIDDPNQQVYDQNSGNYIAVEDTTAPGETTTSMSPIPSADEIAIRDNNPAIFVNYGMIMSVQVTYTYDGQPRSCSVSQRFEYPADRTPPPRPNHIDVFANLTMPGANDTPILRDFCVDGLLSPVGDATIDVGYNNVVAEGGTQFLCKDLSWMRRPRLTRECRNTAGVLIYDDHPDAAYFTGEFDADFTLRQQTWEPCDLMLQCGRSPNAVHGGNVTAMLTQPNVRLRMFYHDLPAGCVMNFEAIAVDSAGNRSGRRDQVATKSFLTSKGKTSTPWSLNIQDDEIHYPTCGNNLSTYYIPQAGEMCMVGYYYRCGGC